MADELRIPARVLTGKRPTPAGPTEIQPPVTLVDSSWHLRTDDAAKMLTDNTDFHVIGVLGTQGTGKSSLLNAICGLDTPAYGSVLARPFPQQSPADMLQLRHCTSSIDVQVHPQERIIGIDTPPILSLSVLSELMQADRLPSSLLEMPALRGLRQRQAPYEAIQYTTALHTACWLCSICHLVLILADDLLDPALLEFLQLVDICLHSLPDPFPPSQGQPPATSEQGKAASVVFVPTGLKLEQLSSSHLQDAVLHPLAAALVGTSFSGSAFTPLDCALQPLSTNPPLKPPPPINLFPLPLHQPPSLPPLQLPPTAPQPHATTPQPTPSPTPRQPPTTQPHPGAKPPSRGPAPPSRPGRNNPNNASPAPGSSATASRSQLIRGQTAPAPSQSASAPGSASITGASAAGRETPGLAAQRPSQPPGSWAAAASPDPVAMQMLRNQVLGSGRRPLPRGLTERAWLKAADKAWDAVARSQVLRDVYSRLVATGGSSTVA